MCLSGNPSQLGVEAGCLLPGDNPSVVRRGSREPWTRQAQAFILGVHPSEGPPSSWEAGQRRQPDCGRWPGGEAEAQRASPSANYYSCAIQSANIPHAFQRPSLHISLQHSQLMREQIKLSLLWFNSVIKELQEATGSK